ncbi:MAG: SoxR reducing system RseC family protein [Candidatus Omnitrophica bacterium]|nr:SoxR reducing system RseC family protein [Candidatus Omnitrophota bacterium]
MEIPHFYIGLMLVFVMPPVFLAIDYLAGILIAKLINRQEEFFGYIFMVLGFIFSFIPMARFGKHINPKYTIVEIKKIYLDNFLFKYYICIIEYKNMNGGSLNEEILRFIQRSI